MFARFDEKPAMTFQDIKETKRYGWMDARMDNLKTVYPPQTKFAGGINIRLREWTSFKMVNLQRAITTESMVRYGPLSNLKKTSWY